MIDVVRLTENAKKNLVAAKRGTRIDHWNTLSRWSLCLSLRQSLSIQGELDNEMSNVEMTWRTFAGRHEQIYAAIVKLAHNREKAEMSINQFLRLHIQRGASMLAAQSKAGGVTALLELSVLPNGRSV
jgi:DNA sulfur modification protein DndE